VEHHAPDVGTPILSGGFDLRRDQAHMINARIMRIINRRSHILPGELSSDLMNNTFWARVL
jgi:hypothetical protein